MPEETLELNGQHGTTGATIAVQERVNAFVADVEKGDGRKQMQLVTQGGRDQLPRLEEGQLQLAPDARGVGGGKTGHDGHLTRRAKLSGPGMNPVEKMVVNRLEITHGQAARHVDCLQKRHRIAGALDDGLLVVRQRLHLRMKG